jgi:uncharacterized membrane protein YsdA (DUF1294 family)
MVKIPDFVIIFAVYAILIGIVFFFYTYDKRAARKNTGRTPENQLLFFALIGPFGAYAAMQVFRHKTRKLKFYIVPVYAMLHSTILTWFLILSMK